jgi:hypothetical protein
MSKVLRIFCFAIVAGFAAAVACAQDSARPPAVAPSQSNAAAAQAAQVAAPAANPADVSSADAILAATYGVISGPAGQKRDWDRFRSLFAPDARLIPADRAKDGSYFVRPLSPDDYAKLADPYFAKNGFAEREIARKAERYGNIMQIFSTYESRHEAKDAQPFARGINSFQLLFDGKRWWVVTIFWQEETPESPLPKEFLPAAP